MKNLCKSVVRYCVGRRQFSSKTGLLERQYDDAELLARNINSKNYVTKRDKLDYNWETKSEYEIEKDYADRMEKITKLLAVFRGLMIVSSIGVAGTIYMKWGSIKGWWMSKNMRVDDDAIERIVKSKKKSITDIPRISNSELGSDVPGVYYWGHRLGDESCVNKFPRRVPWFDNKRVRHIALGEEGKNLAIDKKGNLLAWDMKSCETILEDQDLVEVQFSNKTAYGLNSKGEILIVPYLDRKAIERNCFWSKSILMPWKSQCHYNLKLDTGNAFYKKGENKITQFSTGNEHLVFISNKGKAYTCATGIGSTVGSSSKGQFGIPFLSQFDAFPERNKVYEVELLNKGLHPDGKLNSRQIVQVACGDYHTLARSSDGELFTFGLNSYGQLGFAVSYDTEYVAFPKKLTTFNAQVKNNNLIKCVDIGCSGNTSYIGVVQAEMDRLSKSNLDYAKCASDMNIQYFSFGNGIYGQLGNGHYKHSQSQPTRLNITNSKENPSSCDDTMSKVDKIYYGKTHNFCKLRNGNILAWGFNENGQLGNGKRTKSPQPESILKILEPGKDYNKKNTSQHSVLEKGLQLNPNQELALGKNSSSIYWKPSPPTIFSYTLSKPFQ